MSCGSRTAAPRLKNYKRFARWLFNGDMPNGANPKIEEEVSLPRPVPVYMTDSHGCRQPTASSSLPTTTAATRI